MAAGAAVTVLPDLSGLDKTFDYAVPGELAAAIQPGVIVRIPLGPRMVRGWVLGAADSDRDAGVLKPITKIASLGPPQELVALARYGAWRYAGRLRPFLAAASPSRNVQYLPSRSAVHPRAGQEHRDNDVAVAARRCLSEAISILRLPPASLRLEVVTEALSELGGNGDLLVLVPEHRDVERLARSLERLGHAVARYPENWAEGFAGGRVVIGTRNAVFAPVGELKAILVFDAHAQAYVSERAPTWSAVVLATTRAARLRIPCVLVSAVPTVELLAMGTLVRCARATERANWPHLLVLDRRGEDPRTGLFGDELPRVVRSAREKDPKHPLVFVLNRRGRARLLACQSCGELVRCEHCGGALAEPGPKVPPVVRELRCLRCNESRPAICAHCHSTQLKLLRIGISRAAEELTALLGEEVEEVSSTTEGEVTGSVLVGTEAVLHRVRQASTVVFLDFDQELLGISMRASENALALLALAGRVVGRPGGLLVVQGRLVHHEVLEAVSKADPELFSDSEQVRRKELGLPPFRALALVSGDSAAQFVHTLASPIEAVGLEGKGFLLRAPDSSVLADGLEQVDLPREGLRIEVDPIRL